MSNDEKNQILKNSSEEKKLGPTKYNLTNQPPMI